MSVKNEVNEIILLLDKSSDNLKDTKTFSYTYTTNRIYSVLIFTECENKFIISSRFRDDTDYSTIFTEIDGSDIMSDLVAMLNTALDLRGIISNCGEVKLFSRNRIMLNINDNYVYIAMSDGKSIVRAAIDCCEIRYVLTMFKSVFGIDTGLTEE